MPEIVPMTSQTTYVMGHRNPDTDAICSAVGYAHFLQRTGREDVEAACCGPLNPRTAWVLRYAGVKEPRLLPDLRPRAIDICQRKVVVAHPGETFLDVYQKMVANHYRAIPVVDENGVVVGMPTILEILELLLPAGEVRTEARFVKASLRNIANCLEGALFATGPSLENEEDLVLLVGASSIDTIQARMRKFPPHSLIVLVGDRPRTQRLVVSAGVRCLVLTGGFEPSQELLEAADEHGVCIICTKQDTASAAQLIRCSRQVTGILNSEFKSFDENALASQILRDVRDDHQVLFPVVEKQSGKLLGVISKSDLVEPRRPRLILVDHNEFSQAVPGADEAVIESVIDHHRLSGDLVSREPIRFINEPVGSTSTIVTLFYMRQQMEPEPSIAICLAAGIISDTLHLTSPTTTETDRTMLAWLSRCAGLELEQFSNDFFATGSLLKAYPPREAIESDRKEFVESGWRISISQIEELGLEEFWRQRTELGETLETLRHAQKLDFACLMVTDIARNDSILLTTNCPPIEKAIEYPRIDAHLFRLDGVVSRKKQLFPYLSNVLAKTDAEEVLPA